MKILPTLEGGLRFDAEDAGDWAFLQAIIHDASHRGSDLARDLAELLHDDEGADDWQEYVVPDLSDEFQNQISFIAGAIESAMEKSNGGPGSLWITRESGLLWYGALNQARLSIESRHQFGTSEDVDVAALLPEDRSAFLRSQFYLAVQGLLLEHVM